MYFVDFISPSEIVKRVCKKDLRICWDKKLEKLKRSIRKDSVSRLQNTETFQPLTRFVLFQYDISVSFTLHFSYPFVPIFFKKNLYSNNILYYDVKRNWDFFFNSHNSVLILPRIDGEISENERERKYFHQVSIVLGVGSINDFSSLRDRWALQLRSVGQVCFASEVNAFGTSIKSFAAREHHAGL